MEYELCFRLIKSLETQIFHGQFVSQNRCLTSWTKWLKKIKFPSIYWFFSAANLRWIISPQLWKNDMIVYQKQSALSAKFADSADFIFINTDPYSSKYPFSMLSRIILSTNGQTSGRAVRMGSMRLYTCSLFTPPRPQVCPWVR